MPKAYSNIGNAMMAHYRQQQAAEAANQQLMMSLFAPMKFKQVEADKDRAARKAEAEYRYEKEEEARDAERQLTKDKTDWEAENKYQLELMKQWHETERLKYKTENEPPDVDTYSTSELTAEGNKALKLGAMSNAHEQDLDKHKKIQYIMSLDEDGIKKLGDSDPILKDLKELWSKQQPIDLGTGVRGEVRPTYNDYAAKLGLMPEQVVDALIAEQKYDMSQDLVTGLISLVGVPEEQGAPVITSAMGNISGFEEGVEAIPYARNEDRIKARVNEMYNPSGQGEQSEELSDTDIDAALKKHFGD